MKTLNIILILTVTALLSSACQTDSTTPNKPVETANKANTNSNQTAGPANKTESNTNSNDAKSETDSVPSNSASTPTAAYKAAYAARKNKDVKALKQLISKDMLEFFEILGDGKPNAVDEGLKQMFETPQGPSDETRNEKITGDTATLEYRDPKGAWQTMDFIKEDGVWKMTIPKMEGENKSK